MAEKLTKEETIHLRNKHIGPSCTLFFREDPLKIVKTKGSYIYDEKGRQYLDCINNVAHVGHCHPHVAQAGSEQMHLQNTNSRFLHDNLVTYAQRLASLFPPELKVCYFVNSGSEANDLALRLARAHTAKCDVIVLERAYHGALTTLVDISPYKHRNPSDLKNWVHVLASLYAEEVKSLCTKANAEGGGLSAFFVESIQGCGGQIVYPEGYLKEAFRHVREAGGVCIADEVQVGFGRVGDHWWGFQTQGEDIVPDIVTLGKPMGNGYPVSGVITTREIAESFSATGIDYFSTFGGNPVSCAVANAVLDVIENENLMSHAKEVGGYLKKEFQRLMTKHEIIGDVRGYGMFLGIELVKDRTTREPAKEETAYINRKLKNNGILLNYDGPYENVFKLKPPLVFTMMNAKELVEKFDEVLTTLTKSSNEAHNFSTETGLSESNHVEEKMIKSSQPTKVKAQA